METTLIIQNSNDMTTLQIMVKKPDQTNHAVINKGCIKNFKQEIPSHCHLERSQYPLSLWSC